MKPYENFPLKTILTTNANALVIDIIGAAIIFQLGIGWMILYILYVIYLEFKLMQTSCRNCYYYDKYCAFGKGKLCSLIYPKGKPEKFFQRKITRKNILPDMLISIVPIIIGVVLMTRHFNRWILIGIIAIIALTTQGNSYCRGKLACPHCHQKDNCPALKFFSKLKK